MGEKVAMMIVVVVMYFVGLFMGITAPDCVRESFGLVTGACEEKK